MRNRQEELTKTCPLVMNIFEIMIAPHYVYLDKEQTQGAVMVEMKTPMKTNSIGDYLHEKVVVKAMELIQYNLNQLLVLAEICPFAAWKVDLKEIC